MFSSWSASASSPPRPAIDEPPATSPAWSLVARAGRTRRCRNGTMRDGVGSCGVVTRWKVSLGQRRASDADADGRCAASEVKACRRSGCSGRDAVAGATLPIDALPDRTTIDCWSIRCSQRSHKGPALERPWIISRSADNPGDYAGNVPFTGDDVHFHETKPRSRSLKRMGTASRDAHYRSLPTETALAPCDS